MENFSSIKKNCTNIIAKNKKNPPSPTFENKSDVSRPGGKSKWIIFVKGKIRRTCMIVKLLLLCPS